MRDALVGFVANIVGTSGRGKPINAQVSYHLANSKVKKVSAQTVEKFVCFQMNCARVRF